MAVFGHLIARRATPKGRGAQRRVISVRPAWRTHLEVKVLYIPGKGKC